MNIWNTPLPVLRKLSEIAAARDAVVEAAKAWVKATIADPAEQRELIALVSNTAALMNLESELAELEAKRG
jgi:hypothetical protein